MRKTKKGFVFFICLIILLLLSESSGAEKLKLRVVVDKANVRLRSDIRSIVIDTVPLGTIFELEEEVGEWFKVSLPPDESGHIVTGYIHSSTVEVLKEREDEEIPAEVSPASPVVEHEEPQPPPALRAPAAHRIGFGLKLSGGMSYLSIGDLNTGFEGRNDYLNELPEEDVEGQYEFLHWGYDFGGEIIVYPIPELGIAIGTGYIQVSKESSIKASEIFYSEEITVMPKISIIPITFGIYYSLPLLSGVNFTLNAGTAYYTCKMSWNRDYSGTLAEYTDSFKATKGTVGFQGSLGFEFEFSPHVALVLEGFGRYAKLKEITGDYKREGSSMFGPIDVSGKYTMWYYEFLMGTEYYARTHFFEEEPYDPPFYRNARKAEIDLSGFSVRAGFKFRF